MSCKYVRDGPGLTGITHGAGANIPGRGNGTAREADDTVRGAFVARLERDGLGGERAYSLRGPVDLSARLGHHMPCRRAYRSHCCHPGERT